MPTDPLFYIVGLGAIFLMAFGRGAFGGGFAVIGVPILALVIDPLTASAMMAPIGSASDPFAIWAFPPRHWSKPDLVWMVPGMLIGLALGATFFVEVNPHVVALAIALITLWFCARFFLSGHNAMGTGKGTPVQPVKALICATVSGFSTFIAHAGNPPIAYYLLPRRLDKTVYVGTLVANFLVSNSVKLLIYIWLFRDRPVIFLMAASLMPALPIGTWIGRRLHDRLNERTLYLTLYSLLALAGLKLLWDSVAQLAG
jgi:uncharacterized membrane protein YfcA